MNNENDISFVASKYKRGHFIVSNGWARLGIYRQSAPGWLRAAAIIGGIVVLSATAALVYHSYYVKDIPENETVSTECLSPVLIVRVIDFENTPLPIVIERIEDVYGVVVTNTPPDVHAYNLSLHYEGNAVDLINTINGILDTQMIVNQK